MVKRLKLGVLLSGYGGNLQAILDNCAQADFPAEVVCVISNNPDAYGLTRAQKRNIPAFGLNHRAYESREVFDKKLHEILTEHQVDLVVLAGYMRLISAEMVAKWPRKMVNIHPSLLPAFKGAHAVRDALEYGVKISGCTVHYVVPEVDAGPIIGQAAVPVYPEDTEDTLSDRIHVEEHRLYSAVLRFLGELHVAKKEMH